MSNSKMPENKKYYVYEWYIKNTGEVFYVGKGTGQRWKVRKRENRYFVLMLNSHECDVRKVKENLTELEAFNLEIELIAYYRENTNFRLTNIQDGGDNPPKFYGDDSPTKRPEVRKKIGLSNKLVYASPKRKREISERMQKFYSTPEGKRIASERSKLIMSNPEVRQKISSSSKSFYTQEKRMKQSEIMKNIYENKEVREKITGKNNGASRRVSQYNKDGDFIAEYNTLKEAEENTGISFKNISKAVRGHRKTAGGYVWKFSDNKNIIYSKRMYSHPVERVRKPIIQLTKNGDVVKEYDSIQTAIKENNFHTHTNISANLRGKTKSAYGYIWIYKK